MGISTKYREAFHNYSKSRRPARLRAHSSIEVLETRQLLSGASSVVITPTAGLVTTEAGESASFSVVLTSQPTASVIIPVSSSNPREGIPDPKSLTFTPDNWDIPEIVTVTGVADGVADGNTPYKVLLAPAVSSDHDYNGLDPDDVSLTNTDEDRAGFVVTPAAGLTTSGPAKPARFTVALSSQPLTTVTVAVASSDTSIATTSTTSLVFTPDNWDAPQAVTVTAVGRGSGATNATYSIVLAPAASADSHYDNLDPTDVTLTDVVDRAAFEATASAEAEAFAMADGPMAGGAMGNPTMNDPVMPAEHAAALALVPTQVATSVAIASGPWSDPDTWMDRRVPGPGADIWVMPGRTVTVDGLFGDPYHTIRISGTLRCETDVDTQIRVDTIIVDSSGSLVIGSSGDPVSPDKTATISFTDTGPIDTAWDPKQVGRGLISEGTVTMQGAVKAPYAALAVTPRARDTRLILASPAAGWRTGDRIVVPGSMENGSIDEVFRIVSASADGRTFNLDHPFLYNRIAPDQPGEQLYAANLTRNVVLQSENAVVASRRGHVMFMTNDVHIYGAGFLDLGRTAGVVVNAQFFPSDPATVRSRYPLHFHMAGADVDLPPAVVEGCVVEGSPSWGYVNHSSHVVFRNDVSYKVHDAHFVTQVGDETGAFIGNMAVEGDTNGFWLHGPGVEVRDNILASFRSLGVNGTGGAGIFVWPLTTRNDLSPAHEVDYFDASNLENKSVVDPNAPAGKVRVESVPLRISGNLIYGSLFGMRIVSVKPSIDPVRPNLIQGGVIWDTIGGIDFPYTFGVNLRSIRLYSHDAMRNRGGKAAAITGDLVPALMNYVDITAVGWGIGIIAPQRAYNRIAGGYLADTIGIMVKRGNYDPYTNPGQVNRVLDIRGVAFGATNTGGVTQYRLSMDPPDSTFPAWMLFAGDQILLDGRQLYYANQANDQMIVGSGVADLDGLTNAQAWSRYGLAYSGAVAPSDAHLVDWLRGGLVGSRVAVPDLVKLTSSRSPSQWKGYRPVATINTGSPPQILTLVGNPVDLVKGWNILGITINGVNQPFLVYSSTGPDTRVGIKALAVPLTSISPPSALSQPVSTVTNGGSANAIASPRAPQAATNVGTPTLMPASTAPTGAPRVVAVPQLQVGQSMMTSAMKPVTVTALNSSTRGRPKARHPRGPRHLPVRTHRALMGHLA